MALWEGKVAAATFRGAVNGPPVQRVLKALDRLSEGSTDDVLGWQAERAERLLQRARRRVRAYQSDHYVASDWSTMPVLTKEEVRRHPDRYRNRRVPARRVTTGGTGGRPLAVDIAMTSFFSEWAHIAYAWRTAGIGLADRKVTFRGSSLGRGFGSQPSFFQPTYNHIVVSPFHLNEATFRSLVSQLEQFRPVAIWGYPSAITPFAQWVRRTGPHRQLRSIKALLLASEGSFDWQVELFREVFDAQVVRWYGQTEKVSFASGCLTSDAYHVLPTYGLLEVVDDRILGTGFTNPATPLVRYDTEDGATAGNAECGCGLPFPTLSEIRGRWDQVYLWGADHEPISTSALNFHDPVFMKFDRFQFRQDEPGRALLRVSVEDGAVSAPSAIEAARLALQARIGDRLLIDVVAVNTNDLLSERGKVVSVDQRYIPAP